jgi:nucleoid-associated protein Lsr2
MTLMVPRLKVLSASGWTAPSTRSILKAEHARALGEALARYVGAARRAGGPTASRGGRRALVNRLNTTEVREWAKAQGIEVKDRGRVPAELVARFEEATGR